jgi:hypothetical protein
LSHRARDVVHVGDQRPLGHVVGIAAGEDEDRHAVVVVAAPEAGRLDGPPAGDDGPGGHGLVGHLPVDAGQIAGGHLAVGIGIRRPLVQPVSTVAEPVVGSLIRPGDESVEGHGHVENGSGHGASCGLAGSIG